MNSILDLQPPTQILNRVHICFFKKDYESILPDPSCFFVFPGNETCGFQGTSNQIPCDILDIHENKAVFSLVESVFP